jgi:phospholipid-binding lipoprotein MlaA
LNRRDPNPRIWNPRVLKQFVPTGTDMGCGYTPPMSRIPRTFFAWRALARASWLALLLPLLLGACAGNAAVRAGESPQDGTLVAASSSDAPQAVASEPAAATPADASADTTVDAAATPPATAPSDAETSPSQPPASEGAGAQVAPTQAEHDYAAIYGANGDTYDPVADPTLPAPAELPSSYDPWEPLNRRVHAFNNVVDRVVAKPLAEAYVAVVPRPVRLGVGNFFNNLGQPVSALNALLQGRPKQAGQSIGRFAVNSTLGLAGVFDPATRFNIPNRSEDFGQTLGVWGWKRSRYVELPLFGPRTVRDVFGLFGDAPLAPLQYIEEDKVRVFLQGLQLVDTRTQLMALDSLREGAADEYALFRDGWMQRRQYQIFGDREREQDTQELPDYLREDPGNPTVPVDVMPYVPGTPGG